MRKTCLAVLVFMALASTAGAEVVSLDISGGFNYDGYISDAEADHAYLYSPPSNWGIGSRLVGTVFGEHWLSSVTSRLYAWQSQVPAGGTGLPDDGEITTDYGDFVLCNDLDAEPVGGFTQVTAPTSPAGVLPLASNVVRAYRPHSGSTGWATATATIVLPANQQDYYDSANFLVSGSNGKVMIYANYDDGNGGTTSSLIYTSPGTPKTTEETGFPDLLAGSSANPDIVEVAAGRMDYSWQQMSDYSIVRDATARIWTFEDALNLDSSSILVGFTLAIYDADSWKTRTAVIYAASANKVYPTYHVDAENGDDATGTGSAANPWASWSRVRQELTGGETVILYDGDYGVIEENQSLPVSDPFSDWVTVKAADGCSPVIEHIKFGAYAGGYMGPQDHTGAYDMYMRFEGLTIEDGVETYGAGKYALVDCLIEKYGPWTGSVDNIEKTALKMFSGTDILIQGCEITNTGTAIAGYGHNIRILDGYFHDCCHDGIRVTGFWNSLIEGNTICRFDDGVSDTEAAWSRHCDLIHIFIPGPGLEGWQNHNVVFRNNRLFDVESQGVQFNNYYASEYHNEIILFENNVFGPTHANTFNNADPCDGLILRHNTAVVLDSPRTFNRWTLSNNTFRIGSESTDVEIYNNILGVCAPPSTADVDLFDWNLILIPGTPSGVGDGRAYGRFTLIGGDADFVDPTDFTGEIGSGSDAINAGTDLFAPDAIYPTDIEGTARDARPDMGAFEYPGRNPAAETAAPVYNDTKYYFVDDFEDGHYNDIDPWLQDENTQGLSWQQDEQATFRFYVSNSDTTLNRNSLVSPTGTSGVQRVATILSEQGGNWVDYVFSFTAANAYLTIGSGPLVLAVDEDNYYWLDISRDNGRLIRVIDGTATQLAADSDIEMPHSGERDYIIYVDHVAGGIQIEVDADADSDIDFTYTDTDTTAQSTFTAGGVGFHDDTDAIYYKLRYDDIFVEVTTFDN